MIDSGKHTKLLWYGKHWGHKIFYSMNPCSINIYGLFWNEQQLTVFPASIDIDIYGFTFAKYQSFEIKTKKTFHGPNSKTFYKYNLLGN